MGIGRGMAGAIAIWGGMGVPGMGGIMGRPWPGMLNGITGCCMAIIGTGAGMGIGRGAAGAIAIWGGMGAGAGTLREVTAMGLNGGRV